MSDLSEEQIKGLKRLMDPFDKSEISKLPKPTAAQTKEVKDDYKKGIRCEICGGWHHPKVVHLDYVGHAALTKRLLEADPLWNWEPCAVNEIGEPRLDDYGGMWGWLTVCGVKRRGYGDAEGKLGANANKERIGDFLRNAAMRFGAALDLWSKADLTKIDMPEDEEKKGDNKKDKKDDGKNIEKDDKPRALTEKEMEIVTPWVDWLNSHIKAGCTLDAFVAACDPQIANINKLAPRLRDYVVKEKDMIVNLLMEKGK